MPPIHPALVHFPIALALFSLVADLAGLVLRNASLRAAGRWSLLGAALTAVAAVASGYYDMGRARLSETADGYVHLHMRIGWVVLTALVVLAAWRWMAERRLAGLHGAAYAGAGMLVAGLIAFQAWYGAEMVYAHGTAVAATGQGVEPKDQARRRLQVVYEFLGAPGGGGHGGAESTGSAAERKAPARPAAPATGGAAPDGHRH